jgi:protein-S-isoprenylcysteine O-methyltransferase Ste14
LPGPLGFAVAGLVVIGAGLVLRVVSVLVLGQSFRTFILVEAGQAVVRRGPYRWVRHPSYTGLLLIVAGFGVGSGNALSLVVSLLLPLPAIALRIFIEESELVYVMGDEYREYQRATARLVPGLW